MKIRQDNPQTLSSTVSSSGNRPHLWSEGISEGISVGISNRLLLLGEKLLREAAQLADTPPLTALHTLPTSVAQFQLTHLKFGKRPTSIPNLISGRLKFIFILKRPPKLGNPTRRERTQWYT